MTMYDYAIRAAFEDARRDNYQHPLGLDPDKIADECGDLIDSVDAMFPETDPNLLVDQPGAEEERQVMVMREAFVRAFEAGLAVGLEAREEGIEVKLHIDKETIAGLVQQALSGAANLKE